MTNGASHRDVSDAETVHAAIAAGNSVLACHTDLPGIWGGKFSQRRSITYDPVSVLARLGPPVHPRQ